VKHECTPLRDLRTELLFVPSFLSDPLHQGAGDYATGSQLDPEPCEWTLCVTFKTYYGTEDLSLKTEVEPGTRLADSPAENPNAFFFSYFAYFRRPKS